MNDLKKRRSALLGELEEVDRRIELAKRPSWDHDDTRSLFDQWAEHEGLAPLTAEAKAAARGWEAARDHWRPTWFLSRDDVGKHRGSEFRHTGTEGSLSLWEDDGVGGCSSSPLMVLTKWTADPWCGYLPDAPRALHVEGNLVEEGTALRFVTYLSRLLDHKGLWEDRPPFPGTIAAHLTYGSLQVIGELQGIEETSHRCPSQADYENGDRRVSSCTFFFRKWREI